MAAKIVTVGGGTGSPILLEGIRRLDVDITAIVSMFDSGGSSGVLKNQYGLPPGDFLKNLIALSHLDTRALDALKYRFEGNSLSPHTIGNLLFVGAKQTTSSIDDLVDVLNGLFQVNGAYDRKVLPVSQGENTQLFAEYADGSIVYGEANIGDGSMPLESYRAITRIGFEGEAKIYQPAAQAISDADLIIVGPGSLYTSIGVSLIVDGMKELLQSSRAKKAYVVNAFTHFPETYQYTASDHARVVCELMGTRPDFIIVSEAAVLTPRRPYPSTDEPVRFDMENLLKFGSQIVPISSIQADGYRHDPAVLAQTIETII